MDRMDRSYTYAGGGYHQREGYQMTGPVDLPKKTPWLYFPTSRWQWAFTSLSIIQVLVALVLEA